MSEFAEFFVVVSALGLAFLIALFIAQIGKR